MRSFITLFPILFMLSACSGHKETATKPSQKEVLDARLIQSANDNGYLYGDFANNVAAKRFINKMVQEHGFDRQQLYALFSQAKRLDWVLGLMEQQKPTALPALGPNGAWNRYRKKFITPENIQNGVVFWNKYKPALLRAEQIYGVPPEIIVGIIGVETRWGKVVGKTRIIDALSTLAFSYPRRADYFAGELETLLLIARSERWEPSQLKGSYAGAMGYGQFMPTAFKQYAVDFNGDGHINLWDPVDAIGSVANYLHAHGWQKAQSVAVMAQGQAPYLESGFKTRYPLTLLTAAGLRPQGAIGNCKEVSLLRLDVGNRYQYWYGLPNFYVITRYNHSMHYAMAVWQLGLNVAQAAY